MPERAATWDALPPAVRDQHDDLFVGEITRPETLAGLCDGIDVVFSSVGLTHQKDSLTFHRQNGDDLVLIKRSSQL